MNWTQNEQLADIHVLNTQTQSRSVITFTWNWSMETFLYNNSKSHQMLSAFFIHFCRLFDNEIILCPFWYVFIKFSNLKDRFLLRRLRNKYKIDSGPSSEFHFYLNWHTMSMCVCVHFNGFELKMIHIRISILWSKYVGCGVISICSFVGLCIKVCLTSYFGW